MHGYKSEVSMPFNGSAPGFINLHTGLVHDIHIFRGNLSLHIHVTLKDSCAVGEDESKALKAE